MNRVYLLVFLGLVLLVGACNEECDSMQVSLAKGPTTSKDTGPPVILEQGIDSNVVRPDDLLHVWLVFTDPDGTDDVVGGLLFDADTHFVYEGGVRFDEGVLHFEVSRAALELIPAAGELRNLQATLWDRAGGFVNSDVLRVTLAN